jgi:tRNA A-37 threonylcarbamoyl transferase component Bud32
MDSGSLNTGRQGPSSTEHARPTPRAGVTLGRYELLLPLAKGGMAEVWAARMRGTRGFQKLVAVKTILANVIDNTRLEQMFLEEAQLASQIHHPNVVTTLDLGEQDGSLYLVMEWVDGEPLTALMSAASKSGGVPLSIGVNLIGQACKGLHAAHSLADENGALLGVVHRDVSPQNLLVTLAGNAKVVDFGIAKATSKVSSLTEAGEVKGKFAYMAPEQVHGHAVDCRTDLFALGIVLYAITTGKHPFRGANPAETVRNICADSAPPLPGSVVAGYPPALERVVMKALEKDPNARFADAKEMLRALEDAMPDALEASFEAQVAEYIQGLFGVRAMERRTAIRVAQEQADRERTDPTGGSAGTMRAISNPVDGGLTNAFRKRWPRWALPLAAIGVVAACGAITVGSLRKSSESPTAGPTPAGAPGLPHSALAAPLAQVPAVTAAELAPEAAPALEEEDTAVARATRKTGSSRPSTPSRAIHRRVAGVPEPTATAEAPRAPAATAPAATATEPTAPNAWDRNQFGGRF